MSEPTAKEFKVSGTLKYLVKGVRPERESMQALQAENAKKGLHQMAPD